VLRSSVVSVVVGLLLSVMPATAHAQDLTAANRVQVPLLNGADPAQIPLGTPIALLFVSAALIFLPTIFGVSG